MNNLEYLFTHDRGRILRNLTMEDDPCYICPKYDVTNPDVCDSDGRCTEVMREWLLSEHVDDESCNQVADQPKRQESPDCESDSREKLEADVRKNYSYTVTTLMYPPSANKNTDMLKALPVDTVIGWLDRQAAITTNQLTSKSDVSKSEETAENATSKCDMRDFGDSREKLEADMRERLGELWADAWDAGSRDSMDDDFDLSVFIALLDRQATIAQDETIHTYNIAAREARKVQEERIAELQEQIAEQRKSLEIAWDDNCKLNDAITKRRAEVNELKAERDEWKAKCERDFDESCRQYADQGECDKTPDCESDSREKLEADVRNAVKASGFGFGIVRSADRIIGWLDRQASITEIEYQEKLHGVCEDYLGLVQERDRLMHEANELKAELEAREHYPHGFVPNSEMVERNGKLQKQVNELTAERDYWKQEVALCMQSAYPPSHSPERAYNPDVMAYPDRHGCTTPSTLVSAVIDGLRDEKAPEYMGLLDEIVKLTEERDGLQDLLRALERELKIARGDLNLTLNNWEQAKGKIRRQTEELAERRRKLDERDQKTVEEIRDDRADYWKSRAEKAEKEREQWRSKCGKLMGLANEMMSA